MHGNCLRTLCERVGARHRSKMSSICPAWASTARETGQRRRRCVALPMAFLSTLARATGVTHRWLAEARDNRYLARIGRDINPSAERSRRRPPSPQVCIAT